MRAGKRQRGRGVHLHVGREIRLRSAGVETGGVALSSYSPDLCPVVVLVKGIVHAVVSSEADHIGNLTERIERCDSTIIEADTVHKDESSAFAHDGHVPAETHRQRSWHRDGTGHDVDPRENLSKLSVRQCWGEGTGLGRHRAFLPSVFATSEARRH